jgi:hypothetical protein
VGVDRYAKKPTYPHKIRLLAYGSPARLTCDIEAHAEGAVFVSNDFLNGARNARLSGSEL